MDFGTTGAGGAVAACNADAPLITLPGACQSQGLECGADGMCGSCPGTLTCFSSRCYEAEGPGTHLDSSAPDLLRALFDSPEGERCTIHKTGSLERVDAALWNAGISDVVMTVRVPCGTSTVTRTVTMPGEMIPKWMEKSWPQMVHVSTTFVLDPPLAVHAGDVVDVLFHADGSHMYDNSAVSAIDQQGTGPNCRFIREVPPVNNPEEDPQWDFRVGLYIH